MSVPQMPQAATLINTSPSPTSGTGTSSTRTTPFSRNTPARIVLGIGSNVLTCSTTVPAPLIAPVPLLPFPSPNAEIVVERLRYISQENPRGSGQLSHFASQ